MPTPYKSIQDLSIYSSTVDLIFLMFSGMCRDMTDDCRNWLYATNTEFHCPIHPLNLKTTYSSYSSLEISRVENQEYYLKCID